LSMVSITMVLVLEGCGQGSDGCYATLGARFTSKRTTL
jgi:hypothetical protein